LDQHQDTSFESLLAKYLLGEAGPEETRRIEEWLAADPANQHYYDQLRLIWEKSLLLTPAPALNADDEEERAWQMLREKLRDPQNAANRRTPLKTLWWIASAAVLLAAVVGSFLWWRNPSATDWQSIATKDAIRTDTLPDGSIITLNKHSSLSTKERTVNLEGEAFFRVARDTRRPFRVRTNDVMITVLGTSFNVRSDAGQTAITVETGAVSVSTRHGSIRLNAGETITLRQSDSILQKHPAGTPLHEYYRPRDFVCNDTPLWQLVDALNQAYDVHIRIGNPALHDLPINTVFHDEKLDRILSVIGETLNIRVIRSGTSITLQ
jgi:transmembrane sensor